MRSFVLSPSCRSLDTTWRRYLGNDTASLNVANALWPSSRLVFHPNFTTFARQLKARHIPIVDLGGFCPSAGSQFDVNNDDPGGAIGFFPTNRRSIQPPLRTTSFLEEGRAILNAPGTDALMLGLDMGEQDDRYIYSYSLEGVLAAGSGSYFEQYRRFRGFSDEIGAWKRAALARSMQTFNAQPRRFPSHTYLVNKSNRRLSICTGECYVCRRA
jgi:hypothetical protein